MAVTITGVKEMERSLRLLPERVSKRVVRKAVIKATSIFEDTIRSKTSAVKDTGKFQASANKRIRTYAGGGVVVGIAGYRVFDLAKVGGKLYPSNLDSLLEFGHRVVVGGTVERLESGTHKSLKAAKSKVTGKRGEGRVVGETKAFHVVRGSFDSTRFRVAGALNSEIAKGIEKEATKLGAASTRGNIASQYTNRKGRTF